MERLGLYLGRHAGMGGGIGVYLRALLRSYLELRSSAEIPTFELLVYGDEGVLEAAYCEELRALHQSAGGESAVHSLDFRFLSSRAGRKIGLLSDQLELAIRLRRDRVTLLHSLANVAALFAPCPQVVTVHDLFQAWPPEGHANAIAYCYRALFALQFSRVAVVVSDLPSVSEEIRARYQVSAAKTSCIPLGVDRSVADWAQRSREEARREFEHLPERYVLLFASSNPRKNTRGMLEAWKRFAAEGEDLDLVVLSQDKAIAAEMVEQALPRLHLLPAQSRERLAALLRGADILLFASHAEGFGLPVLEMLHCGGAVVCPKLEVATQLELSEGLFCCDSRSPASIAEALRRAALCPPQPLRSMRMMADAAEETLRLCLSLGASHQAAVTPAPSSVPVALSGRLRQ